jgi:hypothetical protein
VKAIANLLAQYWRCWVELVEEGFASPKDYVITRTPGVFSLHRLAVTVWELCRQPGKELSERGMFEVLQDLGDYREPHFWRADNDQGAAAFGSMKGFAILADLMIEQLRLAGYSIEPVE